MDLLIVTTVGKLIIELAIDPNKLVNIIIINMGMLAHMLSIMSKCYKITFTYPVHSYRDLHVDNNM